MNRARNASLLYIPEDDDPRKVLAAGPCLALPPVVESGHLCAYEEHRAWRPPGEHPNPGCYMCQSLQRAIPLVWEGVTVPEGCDRLLRCAQAYRVTRRAPVANAVERRAKAIYATFPGAERHPWVDHGTSDRQADARACAVNELSDADKRVYVGPPVVLHLDYRWAEAAEIADFAVRLLGGSVVMLHSEEKE